MLSGVRRLTDGAKHLASIEEGNKQILRPSADGLRMTASAASHFLARPALEPFQKRIPDVTLQDLGEFSPSSRQIKHIDHFLAFRVDECDLDVAAQLGEHGAYLVEEPRAVLGDELKQSAVGG